MTQLGRALGIANQKRARNGMLYWYLPLSQFVHVNDVRFHVDRSQFVINTSRMRNLLILVSLAVPGSVESWSFGELLPVWSKDSNIPHLSKQNFMVDLVDYPPSEVIWGPFTPTRWSLSITRGVANAELLTSAIIKARPHNTAIHAVFYIMVHLCNIVRFLQTSVLTYSKILSQHTT